MFSKRIAHSTSSSHDSDESPPQMRLISQILLSFLFVSLIGASASAAPVPEVKLKYLTPDNFKSTIEKGVWSVKLFLFLIARLMILFE